MFAFYGEFFIHELLLVVKIIQEVKAQVNFMLTNYMLETVPMTFIISHIQRLIILNGREARKDDGVALHLREDLTGHILCTLDK